MPFDPAKTVKNKVVLLTGDDSESRRKAVGQLLEAAGLHPDDMDLESVVADSKPIADWIGSACMVPFLADRRAVIVRNILRADLKKTHPNDTLNKDHPVVRNLKELPDSALLVLVADEEVKTEDRNDRSTAAATQWGKVIKLVGGEVVSFTVPTQNVQKVVRDRAAEYGKRMSPRAAQALMEMTAGKADVALSELEKLILYVGDEEEIREDDVKASVTPDHEYNVFKLLDAITSGQTVQALTQLRTLFGKTSKIENEAFPRIFPVLTRQFRLLWQARACVEAGCSASNPSPQALEAFAKTPNLAKEKDWLQGKLMQSARRLGYPQLHRCLTLMLDADAKMKGLRPAYDALDTLEQTVIGMTEACKAR